MKKPIYLFMAFALLSGVTAKAQTPLRATLGKLFELAEMQNSDIGVAKEAIQVAEQQEKVARNAQLPQIKASLMLAYLGNGKILDRDFSNPVRDKLPHFSNTLDLEVFQPLYTGGSIAGGIALSGKQTEMARLGLDAARNAIRMTIVRNFLELAKNRNLLAVYDENIRLTEKLLGEMKVKHSQGVALKNDITRYELKLSSLNYDRLAIRNAIRICNANLTSLLGLDPATELLPEASADTLPPMASEAWMQSAQTHSTQIKGYGLQSDMEQLGKRITHAAYLPQIGLAGGNRFLGPITFEVPTLDKNYNAWTVGLSVSWNISSLFTTGKATKKHDLELTRIHDEQKTTEEAIGRQIHEALTLYRQSIERLDIERKNIQLAEENYAVVSSRFDNQLALLTDMLDASAARLDAGVRLVNAEISAQYYYYQLHFITGTLITL